MTAEPRFATARTDRSTYGGEVAKLAGLLGFEPMRWQRMLWDRALEHDEQGRLAYREVGVTVGRQCGKSTAELALMLHRCLRWPSQNVKYTAQTGMDARAKLFDDWIPLLEHSPLAEVMRFRRQSGHEAILFDNGSKLGLVASTEKSGHGSTVDMAVLDEAWAHADHRLEQSLRPAMITRPNSQLWVVSTAGSEHQSPFLWEKVAAGRQATEAGLTEGVCYLEWSAEPGSDSSDPEVWRRTIPALGYTITEEAVRGDFLGMARHQFERAMLNMWVSTMGDPIVALDHWESLAEPTAPRPEWVVLGLDIAPKGSSAAIVAVGERGDTLHAAVLEHGPGCDWVPRALERIVAEWGGPRLLVDGKACAQMLPELERATGFKVSELKTADVPVACEFWLRLVQESRLKHRGEKELTIALDGAGQRTLGDGWAWSRRSSGVDISPLVALTVAVSFWHGAWGSL